MLYIYIAALPHRMVYGLRIHNFSESLLDLFNNESQFNIFNLKVIRMRDIKCQFENRGSPF